jgi:hypothetical protein
MIGPHPIAPAPHPGALGEPSSHAPPRSRPSPRPPHRSLGEEALYRVSLGTGEFRGGTNTPDVEHRRKRARPLKSTMPSRLQRPSVCRHLESGRLLRQGPFAGAKARVLCQWSSPPGLSQRVPYHGQRSSHLIRMAFRS